MKYIKILLISFTLTIFLTGCTNDLPSDEVKEFFNNISLDEKYLTYLSESHNLYKDISKELENTINNGLNKIEVYVIRETIRTSDSEIVVQVDGIDFVSIANEVYYKYIYEVNAKETLTDSEIEDILIREINKTKKYTRSGYIYLDKMNGKWNVRYDNVLFELIFGDVN